MAAPKRPDQTTDDSTGRGAAFGDHLDLDAWFQRLGDAQAPVSYNAPLGRLGDYELLEIAGRGGQGIVYKAWQARTGREIVLKRLTAGVFATQESNARFKREVEAAAALNHPNIVTIYGTEVIDDQLVLAMQWIDGIPFDRWAANSNVERATDAAAPHRRSTPEILSVFATLCDAIHHAHQRGVIHRDIKPSNILVDRANQPHVLDFGVAKRIDPDGDAGGRVEPLTETGQFLGTPAYAAPEQVRGDARAVEVRTDVYSLGAVLYEALTGSLPFDTSQPLSGLIADIENCAPRPPSSIDRRVNREVDAIVLKALEKEPARRYASVDALARDARRLLSGEPIEARHNSTTYVLRKLIWRYRLAFGIAAAFCVVLIAATAISSTLYIKAVEAQRTAVASASRANRVSSYMNSMLGVANPHAPEYAKSMTVRQLIDQLANRAASELADESETEAALRSTFGIAYRGLGETALAQEQFQRAMTLTEHAPNATRQRVMALRGLALVAHDTGDYVTADRCIRDGLRLATDAADSELVGACEQVLSDLLRHQNRLAESEQAARRALATADAARPRDRGPCLATLSQTLVEAGRPREAIAQLHEAIESTLKFGDEMGAAEYQLQLSNLLLSVSELDEAEALARTALKTLQSLLSSDHVIVAAAQNGLGNVFNTRVRLPEAEACYREALRIYESAYGENHPYTATTLSNLGMAIMWQFRSAEAEPLLRRALAILNQNSFNGRLAPGTLFVLGQCLQFQNKIAEAEDCFRQGIELCKQRMGPEHTLTAEGENLLGELLMARGQVGDAEPLFQHSLRVRIERLGEQAEETLRSYANTAWVHEFRGEFEQAEPLFRRVLEGRRRLFGSDNTKTLRVMAQYLRLLGNMRRYELAEPVGAELLDIQRRQMSSGNVNLVPTMTTLSEARLSLGKPAAAESLLLECLKICEDGLPTTHAASWRRFHVMSLLGAAIVARMEADAQAPATQSKSTRSDTPLDIDTAMREAESFLKQGYEGLRDDPHTPRPTTNLDCIAEARGRVVHLYEVWQSLAPDPSRAELLNKWQREASGAP